MEYGELHSTIDTRGIASFGVELSELLRRAFLLLSESIPCGDFDPMQGIIAQLLFAMNGEQSVGRRNEFKALIGNFRTYFKAANPAQPETTNGRIRIAPSADRLEAHLTLVPPRGVGDMPTITTILESLSRERIVFGVDRSIIDRSLSLVREQGDIIWKAVVARGVPPRAAGFRKPKYNWDTIDKSFLRANFSEMNWRLAGVPRPVEKGQDFGVLLEPEPGAPGRDVYGSILAPPPCESSFEIGEDIACSAGGTLTACASGHIICDDNRVDIVPLYVMEEPEPESLENFFFAGAVLVKGDLNGPGRLECDDLFVLGGCEQIRIVSSNDVLIHGGITGRHATDISSDGCIYAAFVSEARLSALDDIVIENAVINSDVSSCSGIRVASPKGIIAGGHIQSLHGVSAATIGSEFGMLTEITVGRDYLVSSHLQDIKRRITDYEDNLGRIKRLKANLARANVPLEQLPRDKQEIFIGILHKEQNYSAELRSLLRRKVILEKRLSGFFVASVAALDSIFPPSRVQILDAISEIKDRLSSVTLRYARNRVVMKSSAAAGA